MPRREVRSDMMMTDHWIRVIPGTDTRASTRSAQ
jgi:hypothetical protein